MEKEFNKIDSPRLFGVFLVFPWRFGSVSKRSQPVQFSFTIPLSLITITKTRGRFTHRWGVIWIACAVMNS